MNPKFSAPFPPEFRESGVLLHVTSLPSRFGIGDFGPAAIAWIDRLADAGQRWWQVLPLGPPGLGNSPYHGLSSFAVNPLVLSPERLVENGLLSALDLDTGDLPAEQVDFDRVTLLKHHLLALAWENFKGGARSDLRGEFEQFCEEKVELQRDAALYMALRTRFGNVPFDVWPRELAAREPGPIAAARAELRDDIDRFVFGQFLLFRQWRTIEEHAARRGIRLLGDLPIFVSPDSAEVWTNPDLFLVDERLRPRFVAGVPPDYFSADGQLWGNPLYDWEAHRRTGYHWWISRLEGRLEYLDAIRIDHFRAFEAAWHVPAGSLTSAPGQWVAGPGAEFFSCVRAALGGLPLLAEDLGTITPAVSELREEFQLPGMRVLQFAFNGDPYNAHLPHNHPHNSVVYTGTHDNDTTRGWYEAAPQHERDSLWQYAGRPPGEPWDAAWEMIRLGLSSPAALAIVPLQDVLGLGSSARMNMPGVPRGQWGWRCTEKALDDADAWRRLRELTQANGRS